MTEKEKKESAEKLLSLGGDCWSIANCDTCLISDESYVACSRENEIIKFCKKYLEEVNMERTINAEDFFNFYNKGFCGTIEYIYDEGPIGKRFILKSKDGYFTINTPYVKIIWPDESKRFPLKKQFKEKVPDFIKRWSPETKIMRHGINTRLSIDFISYIGKDEIIMLSGVSVNKIFEYKPEFVGGFVANCSSVTIDQIKEMNPDELRHILGHYYKEN